MQTVQQLAHEIGETVKNLDLKLSHLDGRASNEIRELREQLLEQAKALGHEMRERHDQMKGQLDQEAGQIRAAMTGREALAEMFAELASRLKNDVQLPGA